MLRHLLLALAIVTLAGNAPALAQGKGGKKFGETVVVLEITTALGVEAKVNVTSVANHKIMDRADAPESAFTLELSSGVYLWIPWDYVVSFHPKEKSQGVVLKDGSVYTGKIKTNVMSDERKVYSLETARKIKVVSAIVAPPREPKNPLKLQPRTIHIHKPTSQSFDLNYFFSRVSSVGTLSSPEHFRMQVAGEELDGNFSDFEKIAMAKKKDRWHITVKAPGGKEIEGPFWRDDRLFFCYLTNGLTLLLDPTNPGFTLERMKDTKEVKGK